MFRVCHLFDELVDGALVADGVEQLSDEVLGGVQVKQLAHDHGGLLGGHLLHVHLRIMTRDKHETSGMANTKRRSSSTIRTSTAATRR